MTGAPAGDAGARGGAPPRAAIAAVVLLLAVVVWIPAAPRVARDAGLGSAIPAFAGAFATAVLGIAWRTRWRTAAALFAVTLTGHACSLALVAAPPYSVYQHFFPWSDLLRDAPPYALAGTDAAALVLVVMLWRARAALRDAAKRALPGWRLPLLVAVGVGAAAVPTGTAARFAGEVALSFVLAAIWGGGLLLAARAAPEEELEAAGRWLAERVTLPRQDGAPRKWDRTVPRAAAGFALVATAFVSFFVTERVPHIDDSVSYLFQAKVLSTGRLSLPAPPEEASFHVDEVIVEGGRWYGYGFPGWPAALALGVLAGVPWLVNPLLAWAIVRMAHALVLRLLGRGVANAVTVLVAVSPWLLFMGASFMPHMLSGALCVATLLAVQRARESGGWAWGAAAGAAAGFAFLTRPLDGVLCGMVAGLWCLGVGGTRLRAAPIAAAAVAGLAVASLLPAYNAALTGRPDRTPFHVWTDGRWGPGVDRYGFGAHIGIPEWRQIDPLPGHGAADVALNLNKNLFMANQDLHGWAFGSLVLAAAALLLVRRRRADLPFLGLVGAFVVGYSGYWFSGGPDLGPRFWFPLLVPLTVLTVTGLNAVAERLTPIGSFRVGAVVAAATLASLVTFVPWRAATKHYRYRRIGADVERLADAHGFGRSIVFVRTDERARYQSAFNLNPPSLDRPATIYALDAGRDARARVVGAFPDRPVWVIEADREIDTEPRVVAGPLPPGTVPE